MAAWIIRFAKSRLPFWQRVRRRLRIIKGQAVINAVENYFLIDFDDRVGGSQSIDFETYIRERFSLYPLRNKIYVNIKSEVNVCTRALHDAKLKLRDVTGWHTAWLLCDIGDILFRLNTPIEDARRGRA